MKKQNKKIIKIEFDEEQSKKTDIKMPTKEKETIVEFPIKNLNEEKSSKINIEDLPFIEPKQENEFEKIEELEKKLKEHKELLKIKEKEEKIRKKLEEKLKGKRSLINPLRWFGLKYKKKKELKLEERIKEPEIVEEQSQTEIKLAEDFSNLKFCPICNYKIKRGKVRKNGEIYIQNLKCKNCNFVKKIVFKI